MSNRSTRVPGFRIKHVDDEVLFVPDDYQEPAQAESPPNPPWGIPNKPPTQIEVVPSTYYDPIGERNYRNRAKTLRPLTVRLENLADVVGQDEAIALVMAMMTSKNPPHLMFFGSPGTGKTTVARAALQAAKAIAGTPFTKDANLVFVDGARTMEDRHNHISSLSTVVIEAFYSGIKERNLKLNLPMDTPEIKPGPMAAAHMSALFIDEIGELPHDSQTVLLTVAEDGIETLPQRAAGQWMRDPRTPKWMTTFMRDGVPASFVLIGATTREPSQIDAALRTRCEIITFKPLTSEHRYEIAKRSAASLDIRFTEKALRHIAATTDNGRDTNRRVILAALASRRRGADCIELVDTRNCPSITTTRTGFRP